MRHRRGFTVSEALAHAQDAAPPSGCPSSG